MPDVSSGTYTPASVRSELSEVNPALSTAAICSDLFSETVCVQAEVTITPAVTVGAITSFCVGDPVIGACQGEPSPSNSCAFMVSQSICVQVPLTFSADATAVPLGISCGEPLAGPCPAVAFCTYTIGYFRNYPAFTNALIEAAGGVIILGIGSAGASFAVNESNATACSPYRRRRRPRR
jgi:hypothetical protein